MPSIPHKATGIGNLGHNDRIEVGQRSFDIQTEILERGSLQVRTTVLEAGKVVHTTSAPLSQSAADVESAAATVSAQHQAIIEATRQGKIS